MKIGFITCQDLGRYFPSATNPLYTHDDQVAADALESRGHTVRPVVWGEQIDAVFDLLIIRSPWDYMDSRESSTRFLCWLEQLDAAGLRLENPLPVVRWNLDKHYLGDLADEDLPVVPTRYLPASEAVDLVALFEQQGELVLKPCVSAAAKDTFLIESRTAAEALRDGKTSPLPFDQLRTGRDFMVQPFLPEVLSEGEWSLVFVDGSYSHAVHKRPAAGNWLVQDELGGSVVSVAPPKEVRAAAIDAFERIAPILDKRGIGLAAAAPLLYGRVDVIPTVSGPLVSELELIEPELFFLQRTARGPLPLQRAIDAFCTGIERRGGSEAAC